MKSLFLPAFIVLWGVCLAGIAEAQTVSEAQNVAGSKSDAEKNLFPTNAVILFQGDSVTDGNRGRSLDPNHIHGHGYVYLIASYLGAKYPEQNWTFFNRGVSGNTLAELDARWQADTFEIHPDVLSLMIGVNDHGRGVSPELFRERYDALLQRTRETLPDVKLILMEPLWRDGSGDVKAAYRAAVRDMAAKYGAVWVPTQADFDSVYDSAPDPKYWVWDSVHPTTAGHWRICEAWLNSVKNK